MDLECRYSLQIAGLSEEVSRMVKSDLCPHQNRLAICETYSIASTFYGFQANHLETQPQTADIVVYRHCPCLS